MGIASVTHHTTMSRVVAATAWAAGGSTSGFTGMRRRIKKRRIPVKIPINCFINLIFFSQDNITVPISPAVCFTNRVKSINAKD